MKPLRLVALGLVLVVLAVSSAAAYLAYSYPELLSPGGAPGGPCPSGAVASGQTHYTIVISSQGFNASGTSDSCPLMSVAAGQSDDTRGEQRP